MAWAVIYYKSARGIVPAFEFMAEECPKKVRANLFAVLGMVADAPPPAFSGGGRWETMHGTMSGYYQVKATGPGRRHYRLFCVLEGGEKAELERRGLSGPAIAVITGMWKPNATLFSEDDYKGVRSLGEDQRKQFPRRVATGDDLKAFLNRVDESN